VILLLYAHPYPSRSRACAALLSALEGMPGLEVRTLYDLYPDFDIDVDAEQAAISRADAVIWMHPMYWYSAPALLQHWFEKVMVHGFAYGAEGSRVAGKPVLWVTTTGGDEGAFSTEGRHHHDFSAFVPAMEQTARYCGLDWREPFMLHGAHLVPDGKLLEAGAVLRRRIESLAGVPVAAETK
jgi:glutathione-regulated potassium-efflux system ancillary protein KefF